MMFRAPRFWGEPAGLLAVGLSPLAAAYGAVAARRMGAPAPRAELPTIVVGGLTLGGDGKTPLVLALVELLTEMGERPATLCRGYGGARGAAPLVVDPARRAAREVGDEALLHAAKTLTIVGADRAASARLAKAKGATALVLDDGLHSGALAPDLALLVVDADYGAGNGLCPPAGPVRAPLAAQLARADAIVVVGQGDPQLDPPFEALTLRARLAPDPAIARRLARASVYGFAGVGRPEKFRRTIEETGARLCGFREFPDHHSYCARELSALRRAAQAAGAQLVTTEKDAVRIGDAADVRSLKVRLLFERENTVRALLQRRLGCGVRKICA
ncbi:MAG TPA: tetraacyldisaccharide 4'-kinase [Methylocystis sp.]|nr:tetraacyldisaccharide 4'-kinase [Methylocystis sp.]